jgi:thiol peroxidase
MASITFRGTTVTTVGSLPAVGSTAPDFSLVASDLSEVNLASFAGRKKVLNIFPSLDTGVCANSVRQFHRKLADKSGVVCINISADLPFAHKRFCTAERIEDVANLSSFRSPEFGTTWGLTMKDGPLKGLLARAVVVLDEKNKVLYVEQVPEIAQEPNYDAALAKV